jgi:hypothetical protein
MLWSRGCSGNFNEIHKLLSKVLRCFGLRLTFMDVTLKLQMSRKNPYRMAATVQDVYLMRLCTFLISAVQLEELLWCIFFYICIVGGGIKVHSTLRPLNGLLCQPRVIMIMEKSVEWLAVETEVLGENLPQCRFVHHKPHMLPVREPGPPRWEASV